MTMATPTKCDPIAHLCGMTSDSLLLTAIIHGRARWEWFGGRKSGEVCVDGLRHACDVRFGTPILTHNIRTAIIKSLKSVELIGFDS